MIVNSSSGLPAASRLRSKQVEVGGGRVSVSVLLRFLQDGSPSTKFLAACWGFSPAA